jgi:hypothetical protein
MSLLKTTETKNKVSMNKEHKTNKHKKDNQVDLYHLENLMMMIMIIQALLKS